MTTCIHGGEGKNRSLFLGSPPQFQSTIRAHYSSSAVKAANAAAHRAVGIILLDSPTLENLHPFKARVRDAWALVRQ